MMNKTSAAIMAALGLALAGAAQSAEPSDWILRFGAHRVEPKSDNHGTVNVDGAQMLTFNLTRMVNDHWGVELLAALPFKHDINLNGGGKVADVKHLPPTLSVQYHFAPEAKIRPYAGVGLNATLFFSEHTTGALAGADLKLGTSFGPAAQVGLDFDITDKWFLNGDVRWMDIDTKAKLDGVSLGTVAIDPLAFGISVGRKF
jgi:outer membrane protein